MASKPVNTFDKRSILRELTYIFRISNIMTGDSDDDDEAILSMIYSECDSLETGNVPASKFIDYLRDKNVDPRILQDMNRLLDPTRDNSYVSRSTFLSIGREWISTMRDATGGAEFRVMDDSNKRGKILDSEDSNNGQLLDQIYKLKHKRQKLQWENTSLKEEVSRYSELNAQFKMELEISERKLMESRMINKSVEALKRDLETLKTLNSSFEDERRMLLSDVETYRTRADRYLFESENLRSELSKSQEATQAVKTRQQVTEAQLRALIAEVSSLKATKDNLTFLLSEMEIEKSDVESKLYSANYTFDQLDADNRLLKQSVERLSAEIRQSNETDESRIQIEAQSRPLNNSASEAWIGTPPAVSTPFLPKNKLRGSIGDEIRDSIGKSVLPIVDKTTTNDVSFEVDHYFENLFESDIKEMIDASTEMTIPQYLIHHSISVSTQTNESSNSNLSSSSSLFLLLFFLFSLFSLTLFLLTFFGALSLGEKDLYPLTWFSFFPEPYAAFKITKLRFSVW